MKKLQKAIAMVCAALCVSLAFAGCSSRQSVSSDQTPKEQGPVDAVNAYFTALKNHDTEAMDRYTVSWNTSSGSSEPDGEETGDANADKMYEAMFSKVVGQVEEDAVIDGDAASVKMKITAPDMKTLVTNALANAFAAAMTTAFSSSGSDSQDTSKMMTDEVIANLSKPDVVLSTTEMNVQLVKKDGQWKIQSSENFVNALTGGLYSLGGAFGSAGSQ